MAEATEAGRGRGGGRGRGRGRGRAGRGGRQGRSGRDGGPGRSSGRGANATDTTAAGAEQRSRITSNTQAPKETMTVESTATAPPHPSAKDTGRGGRAGGRGGRGRGSGGARGRGNNKGNKNQQQEQHQKQKPDPKNKDHEQQQKQTSVKKKDKNKPKNDNKQQGRAPPPDKKHKNTTAAATNHANTTHAPSIPPSQSQQTSDINYMRGESITILHVAEKPSIAQAIAKGLAPPSANIASRSNKLPVHEFTDTTARPFPKAPHAARCRHRVTSVAGHVFNVDFPPQFQSWESVDPAELFHAPTVRKPCQGSVVRHLQEEARGVHFIVLWMDCDREGENINFEVLDCCMHLMAPGGGGSNYDRVYRAHFSAINPTDIQKAYQNLGKPDKNQSLSVEARQELDLKVGVAFSRFQTRFFQGRYGDLDSAVLTYGPCQTPTLGFCVQRHMEIETFKPEPYWVLELAVMKRGRMLRALWDSGRSFNKNRVESLLTQALESEPVVKVMNVVTKEKKQGRPIPLNTVALLKACSKALGIGPHAAMQSAERLYLTGYLSYPRTESSTYPKSFDIAGTLQQQTSDNRWGKYVSDLLSAGFNKSRGGVDMGDHPPITPCRAARAHELSGDLARVYDLVVRHFIASVSQDAVWQSTRVDFGLESLGEKGSFTLRGKELVSPGFLAILLNKEYGEDAERETGGEDDEEERSIPEFVKGEMIPLVNTKSSASSTKVAVVTAAQSAVRATLEIKEKMTTPPSYLTESELIGMMEKNGIGTDASISTHIENVQKRNYVSLESGRRLLPSKLGLVLAQGYHLIDSSLVLPKVRSDIEDQCNKIAKGEASKDAVVRKAIELFSGKFDVFVKNIEKMDVLFGSSFSALSEVGKPFTRCGLTRRYLQYIAGPPVRLYNRWTESVYPLPSGGVIKQWTGRMCSVEGCNFELCLYSVGHPERTFPLCPRCVNDPVYSLEASNATSDPVDQADEAKERQIKKIAGKNLVLECPLPDSHPLVEELTVSPDPDSEGVLILDPHFGPKWRLVSTRDPTIIYMPQSIEKITILEKRDEVLGVRLMRVDFKDGESPLPDKKKNHVCCFANDATLQSMVRVYHGSDRLKATGRGGRGGRGRGRGRGGRGRGRGR